MYESNPFVLPFSEWSSASEVATEQVKLIILSFHTISAFPISHQNGRIEVGLPRLESKQENAGGEKWGN